MPKLRSSRIRELVRQFKENGMKLMLEHPANVRDLLSLLHAPWFDDIDFSRLQPIKTTFIRRDYRHLESDLVLTAPLAGRTRSRKSVLICILIEHQSEPDRLMPLRLADSQLQIFRDQVRKWSQTQTHRSLARVALSPVLPVVFYTGLRRWAAGRDVGGSDRTRRQVPSGYADRGTALICEPARDGRCDAGARRRFLWLGAPVGPAASRAGC
jgi:hypothetical protein